MQVIQDFIPQKVLMTHARPVCAGVRRALDGDAGPHIIVAPASLLQNWQRELQRWCPGLRAVLYYGKERGLLRERLSAWRCAGPGLGSCTPQHRTPDLPCEEPHSGAALWQGTHAAM